MDRWRSFGGSAVVARRGAVAFVGLFVASSASWAIADAQDRASPTRTTATCVPVAEPPDSPYSLSSERAPEGGVRSTIRGPNSLVVTVTTPDDDGARGRRRFQLRFEAPEGRTLRRVVVGRSGEESMALIDVVPVDGRNDAVGLLFAAYAGEDCVRGRLVAYVVAVRDVGLSLLGHGEVGTEHRAFGTCSMNATVHLRWEAGRVLVSRRLEIARPSVPGDDAPELVEAQRRYDGALAEARAEALRLRREASARGAAREELSELDERARAAEHSLLESSAFEMGQPHRLCGFPDMAGACEPRQLVTDCFALGERPAPATPQRPPP